MQMRTRNFFVAGETKIITVNGKEYTITNTASNDNKNLVYSIKGDTIEFQGTYFKITGNSRAKSQCKVTITEDDFYRRKI